MDNFKVLFLDNDGVVCLANNWGSRYKKRVKDRVTETDARKMPVEYRFDNFDKGAVKVLNEVLESTGAEIVVSSDWRMWANLDELGEYYLSQGFCKKPISVTKMLKDCDQPEDFPWNRNWDLEQSRTLEIKQWLRDNPGVTHWVAVDDLHMGIKGKKDYREFYHEWGLKNFVWTPYDREGIKQSGVKQKLLKYLQDE